MIKSAHERSLSVSLLVSVEFNVFRKNSKNLKSQSRTKTCIERERETDPGRRFVLLDQRTWLEPGNQEVYPLAERTEIKVHSRAGVTLLWSITRRVFFFTREEHVLWHSGQ